MRSSNVPEQDFRGAPAAVSADDDPVEVVLGGVGDDRAVGSTLLGRGVDLDAVLARALGGLLERPLRALLEVRVSVVEAIRKAVALLVVAERIEHERDGDLGVGERGTGVLQRGVGVGRAIDRDENASGQGEG